jgi:23S rRNA (adenine2030-N6)-methyltransferase
MNYRHAYHAGSFCDVVKHAVLALILDHLRKKDKPFFVLDAHAGIGRYDLNAPEAKKTGEAEGGIYRLWAAADFPPELKPYLAAVKSENGRSKAPPRWYPGSPRIIRHMMRSTDRLFAVELHPDDARTLKREFGRDRAVKVMEMDGYIALKSLLPPDERRGLVVLDPAFEVTDEFARMAEGLKEAHRRWAGGIYALWYPVKDVTAAEAFRKLVKSSGVKPVLSAELWVEKPGDPEKLTGSALLIVNPPFTLKASLDSLFPFLAGVLARGPGAGSRVEWLVPE